MTVSDFRARWQGHTPKPLGMQREYAVLVPLVEGGEGPALLFEVRADTLARQPGEVCFPGGRMEPGETPGQCALRESWEELGIPPEQVELIAPLDFQCGRGEFVFYPVLGRVAPEAAAALRPNPGEVKETFCVPAAFFWSIRRRYTGMTWSPTWERISPMTALASHRVTPCGGAG